MPSRKAARDGFRKALLESENKGERTVSVGLRCWTRLPLNRLSVVETASVQRSTALMIPRELEVTRKAGRRRFCYFPNRGDRRKTWFRYELRLAAYRKSEKGRQRDGEAWRSARKTERPCYSSS